MMPLLFFLIFLSCTTSENKVPEEIKKAIEYPEEIQKFINLFPDLNQELNLDKAFMQDSSLNHTKHKLSLKEVQLLAKNLSKDEFTEINEYYLKDYSKIEQSKLNKKYKEYTDSLDIGMMQDANCFALGKIELGDSLAILIWKLDFASYEACPYYSGTHFMASIVYTKQVVQTIQVACDESAADAPFSSSTLQEAKFFKKGKISTKSESVSLEEEKEIEHLNKKIDYYLSAKGFIKK